MFRTHFQPIRRAPSIYVQPCSWPRGLYKQAKQSSVTLEVWTGANNPLTRHSPLPLPDLFRAPLSHLYFAPTCGITYPLHVPRTAVWTLVRCTQHPTQLAIFQLAAPNTVGSTSVYGTYLSSKFSIATTQHRFLNSTWFNSHLDKSRLIYPCEGCLFSGIVTLWLPGYGDETSWWNWWWRRWSLRPIKCPTILTLL